MGYALEPHKVRADFFTDTGKWKYTEVLDMAGLWDFMQTQHAVSVAWERMNRHRDLVMVVLEPYHRFSYPMHITPVRCSNFALQALNACPEDVNRLMTWRSYETGEPLRAEV